MFLEESRPAWVVYLKAVCVLYGMCSLYLSLATIEICLSGGNNTTPSHMGFAIATLKDGTLSKISLIASFTILNLPPHLSSAQQLFLDFLPVWCGHQPPCSLARCFIFLATCFSFTVSKITRLNISIHMGYLDDSIQMPCLTCPPCDPMTPPPKIVIMCVQFGARELSWLGNHSICYTLIYLGK